MGPRAQVSRDEGRAAHDGQTQFCWRILSSAGSITTNANASVTLKSYFISWRTRLAGLILVGVSSVLLADWREWIDQPDLISEFRSFDRFHVYGEAPWCFLNPAVPHFYFDPKSESIFCHYLSENHCAFANYFDMKADEPDERGVCAPNPIK